MQRTIVTVPNPTPQAILDAVGAEAAELGWSAEEILDLMDRASGGDYCELLEIVEEYFDIEVARRPIP